MPIHRDMKCSIDLLAHVIVYDVFALSLSIALIAAIAMYFVGKISNSLYLVKCYRSVYAIDYWLSYRQCMAVVLN